MLAELEHFELEPTSTEPNAEQRDSLQLVTDGVSARAGSDLIDFPTTTPSCKCTNSSTNYASRSLTDTQRLRSRSKMQVPRSPPALHDSIKTAPTIGAAAHLPVHTQAARSVKH